MHPRRDLRGWLYLPALILAALILAAGLTGLHYLPGEEAAPCSKSSPLSPCSSP